MVTKKLSFINRIKSIFLKNDALFSGAIVGSRVNLNFKGEFQREVEIVPIHIGIIRSFPNTFKDFFQEMNSMYFFPDIPMF